MSRQLLYSEQAILNDVYDADNGKLKFTSGESNTLPVNGVDTSVKRGIISTATSGDNTLVAASSGKKIRVINIVLMANGTVNVKFKSGANNDMTGLLYLVANTGFAPGYNPTGHFTTDASAAFIINLSANIAVGGWFSYVEV